MTPKSIHHYQVNIHHLHDDDDVGDDGEDNDDSDDDDDLGLVLPELHVRGGEHLLSRRL